ncbi:hypothetical protein [Myroides sp. DF42-4-2]|uniref:hypothetical protein n=1 Tax=unclassified Myroides TaxID=2642485 RepID=UPI002575EEDF|nr:hypothetical protein [Myroides sp. DF42-4-2]MDM1408048.1 hypothetical protein [Myroides sp. DF42-4-2]
MKYLIDLQEYLLYNLQQIGVSVKLSGVVGVLAVVVGNVSGVFTQWWSENIDYVVIALGLVAVDHLLGSGVHLWLKKDFQWPKNIIGLMIKLSMVLCGGLIFEGLAHITKEQDLVYTYLKMTTRLIVCIYPGLSAMRNMNFVTRGVFPPAALVGKFDSFQKDLSVEKLKKGKENEGD